MENETPVERENRLADMRAYAEKRKDKVPFR
jgi:hypothetical protein